MARLTYEQRWNRLIQHMRRKRLEWDIESGPSLWSRGSFWALDDALKVARSLSRPQPRKEKRR